MQRYENLLYINSGVNGQQIDAIHMVTVRPGRSTPADLVQSRFSQIGPRSVSELESDLTLFVIPSPLASVSALPGETQTQKFGLFSHAVY